jgi:hypothetical protein
MMVSKLTRHHPGVHVGRSSAAIQALKGAAAKHGIELVGPLLQ